MPLVAYNDLPTFERLKQEGRTVLPPDRAAKQDIREMHIGLLNMMPDAALTATERQFFRHVGESNQIAQLYVHPFTLPELERSAETKEYVKKYYEPFEKLQEEGLDALIVTGANISQPHLEKEPFWEPLKKVIDWSWNNVTSTLCSCLATHAVMQFRYNQKRTPLPGGQKLWGVYRHRIEDRTHPLVRNMNTVFDVPHSRFNAISEDQFHAAKMKILVKGNESGTHIAVSADGFRLVCMQGHPEYDTISLLKEYERELRRFETGERPDCPPFPENYFKPEIIEKIQPHPEKQPTMALLDKHREFISDNLENTWTDSGRSILSSWIGLVYQVTHSDRKRQFMEEIDPDAPLRGL